MKIRNLLWLLALTMVPTLARSQTVPMVLPMVGSAAGEDSIRYVGGPMMARSGEDIGAQINTAYASLPPQGGTVVVIANPNGACYDFITPIVASVPGKYLLLEGGILPSQVMRAALPACLNYLQTTASSAVTFDYVVAGKNPTVMIHGIRNLTLTNNHCEAIGGCSSAATGVTLGGANGGAEGGTFDGVRVIGFGTGVSVIFSRSHGGSLTFRNCRVSYNTQGLIDAHAHGEHVAVDNCYIEGNGTGISSSAPIRISNSTMDSNTMVGVNCVSPAACDLNGDHFENSDADSTHFLSGTGVFSVMGGDMRDMRATGNTDWWMNFTGATFFIIGTVLTSQGRTAAHVIQNEGKGVALLRNNSPNALPHLYSHPSIARSFASDAYSNPRQNSFQDSTQVGAANPVIVPAPALPPVASKMNNTGAPSHTESTVSGTNESSFSNIVMVDGVKHSTEKSALFAAGKSGVVFDTPFVNATTLHAPTQENTSLYNFSSVTFLDWNGTPRFTNYLYRDNSIGSASARTSSSIFLQPQTTVTVDGGIGQEMDSVLIFPKWNLSTSGTPPPTLSGLAVAAPFLGSGSIKARDSATLRIESNPPVSTCLKDSNGIPQCWALAVDAGQVKLGSNVYFSESHTGINMSTGIDGSTLSVTNLDGGASTLTLGQAGASRLVVSGNAFYPSAAGAMSLGLGSSPYYGVFIGNEATKNAMLTGTFAEPTTITVPDPGQATATLAYRNVSQNWAGDQVNMALASPKLTNAVINGPTTGAGVQGSDPRLLTSGIVSGKGNPLCLDANGGATTSGCTGPAATLFRVAKAGPSCTTSASSYSSCTSGLTWSVPFPDANYSVTCTGIGPSDPRANLTVASRSPTAVVVNVVTYGSVAVSFLEIDCTGVQNPTSATTASTLPPIPEQQKPRAEWKPPTAPSRALVDDNN